MLTAGGGDAALALRVAAATAAERGAVLAGRSLALVLGCRSSSAPSGVRCATGLAVRPALAPAALAPAALERCTPASWPVSARNSMEIEASKTAALDLPFFS